MGATTTGLVAGVAALWALGCSGVTEVQPTDLADLVARDGVPFANVEIPASVIDRVAAHRLVIVGETHHLEEHAVFMDALLRALQREGFRQLLMEWPQMADWLLEDFVNGGDLEPDWTPPPPLNGHLIERIRVFNGDVGPDQRISVRGIDVNLSDYGGANGFRDLIGTYVEHLGGTGSVATFLAAEYGNADEQERSIESLRRDVAEGQAGLTSLWGPAGYARVAEMIEVEVASVAVRANREDHYDLSVRLRESAMKRLTDMRLEGYPHGSVLNVGSSHAQKQHLRGTSQEWLGDHLVNRSDAVGGSVFVLAAVPARIHPPAGGEAGFDLEDASPPNELFRVMHETWPGRTIFLPLDDAVFSRGGIPLNFEGIIYTCAPKAQYDAVLLYSEAQRIPVP